VSNKPTQHIEQGVGYARAAEADQPSSSGGSQETAQAGYSSGSQETTQAGYSSRGQTTTQAPCSDQKDAEEASGVQRSSTMLQVKITFSAKVAKCFSANTIIILIKLGMGASACVQGVQ
jgi:hypothetical protein